MPPGLNISERSVHRKLLSSTHEYDSTINTMPISEEPSPSCEANSSLAVTK